MAARGWSVGDLNAALPQPHESSMLAPVKGPVSNRNCDKSHVSRNVERQLVCVVGCSAAAAPGDDHATSAIAADGVDLLNVFAITVPRLHTGSRQSSSPQTREVQILPTPPLVGVDRRT
jgi:hypothetical protein